jgi:hypothetical protein
MSDVGKCYFFCAPEPTLCMGCSYVHTFERLILPQLRFEFAYQIITVVSELAMIMGRNPIRLVAQV